MIGRTLSHFKIVSRIGEGGMGVVYRAEDEKLHRPVALKVLPPEAVADEERRLRFLREARAAASLSHPNIAHIYEVDEVDGIVFIAMELIDGKTLRSALAGKALPIRDVLRIAIEIAEGLAKAHHARIVHRDLKPENVMITVDGHVKILDFGLAKLLERDEELSADEASRLETISGEMTKQGRILGTAAYMSPEQARGQAVDSRSDLFAFGIVLYEMVVGKAPFHGPTPMDTLSAILSRSFTPAVQLNAEVPPELDRILGKCLEKDPAERYQDTRDLAVDLKRLKRDTESQPLTRPISGPVATAHSGPGTGPVYAGSGSTPAGPVGSSTSATVGVGTVPIREGAGSSQSQAVPPATAGLRRSRSAMIALGSVVFVLVLAWVGWRYWPSRSEAQSPPAPRELRQRQVIPKSGAAEITGVDLSFDGKYLAISKATGLWVRLLETGEERHIEMPEQQTARAASWSPDGSRLLVTAIDDAGKMSIWSVPLVTGLPRLVRSDDSGGASLSPDGTLISFFAAGPDGPELWVMDSQGGSARKLAAPPRGEWLKSATWSPTSRRIAYQLVRLTPEKSPDGIIESIDPDGGTPVPILTDSRLIMGYGSGGEITWLPDGRLLFSLREPPPTWIDVNIWSLRVNPATGIPEGKPQRITSWAGGRPSAIAATRDGKQLLVDSDLSQSDIWIGELEEGGTRLKTPRQFTLDEHHDRASFWMPDSRRIVFSSDRNGSLDLLVQALDEANARPLVIGPGEIWGGTLTPQRNSFLFAEAPPGEVLLKEVTVKRADLSGGSIETLLKAKFSEQTYDSPVQCTALCLLCEIQGKEAVFYGLDPIKGKLKSVARIPAPETPFINWSLSPDGTRVAYAHSSNGGTSIRILVLADGTVSEILLKGPINVQNLAWAIDGKLIYGGNCGAGKCSLFSVDLQGNYRILMESHTGSEWIGNPIPSPDGHYLAYQKIGLFDDYWILEGF